MDRSSTSQPGSPSSPAWSLAYPRARLDRGGGPAFPSQGARRAVSTRKLIIAALVCGIVILGASALQLYLATR